MTWAERWGEAPLLGRLRVVLQHEAIADGTLLEQRLTRSADNDVTRRNKDVLEKLALEGPDRCIARPPNWREGLQELVREMPHFRGPVRLLSNALALTESACPTRIPPMLLLGTYGLSSGWMATTTHTEQQVAEPSEGLARPDAD